MKRRIISLMLALVMIISFLPVQAFSEGTEEAPDATAAGGENPVALPPEDAPKTEAGESIDTTLPEETTSEVKPDQTEASDETDQTEVTEEIQAAETIPEETVQVETQPAETVPEETISDLVASEETITVQTEKGSETIPITWEEVPFQVNPRYDGLVDASDFDLSQGDPNPVSPMADYVSETEAAAQIRSFLCERIESFTVSIETSNADFSSVCHTVFDAALIHTGVPTEGDYLAWQYGGWRSKGSHGDDGAGTQYYTITFTVPYYTSAAQEEQMDTRVSSLLSQLNLDDKSDYEKIRGVYDYICTNITYDYDNLQDDSYMLKYTAYAALVNGTAVCQGYAVLLYRLALELGVDCRYICGDAGGPHGWNIVKLGSYYYNADATWDAGWSIYNYFLVCPDNFTDHTRDEDYDTEAFHAAYPMDTQDYAPESNILASGTCGENLTWTLDDSGVLTISGTGAMADFSIGNTPWFSEHSSIIKVVIDSGMTQIGDWAFNQCYNLTSVSIPDSVTAIGDDAFSNCNGLTSITIPDSTLSIGNFALHDCTSLTNVIIPNSVTTVGDHAFSHCTSLDSVTIGTNVTSIGNSAFYQCSNLTAIRFYGDVPSFGNDCFSEVTITAYYPANNTSWTIDVMQNYGGTIAWTPYGTASEVASGTCGENLTWVLTDDGTLTISGTGEIVNYDVVNLPPWDAFRSQIQRVEMNVGVTSIGELAFNGCSSLTSITIPDSVTDIGDYAFHNCSSLTSITIPEGVSSISNNAFSWCSSLTSVTILKGVTSIGNYAFSWCSSLTSITIQDSVSNIGDYAFCDCTNLTSITIPEGVTSIGNGAFHYCSSLTSITIPSSVSSIGGDVFSYCDMLEGIWVGEANDNYSSDKNGVLFNKNKTTLIQCPGKKDGIYVIPDSVTSIGNRAFISCDGLTGITIPAGVTSIGNYAFNGCSGLTSITIPDGVTGIGERVFECCSSLTSITIPAGMASIGQCAFYRCSSLKEITFNGNAPEFGTGVFSGVTATAYYPANNETWTEDVMQSYDGIITWVASGAAEEGLSITTQPVDYVGALNSNASFTVAVNREDVTYQWYFSTDGATWKKSSSTGFNTDTLTIKMTSARLGQRYRCEITDSEGNTVVSDAVTMMLPPSTIQIQTQPVDFYGAVGDASPFTVEATGEGLTYRWYYSTTGGETWALSYSSGCETKTLALVLRAYNSGRMYKCLITDANGNTEWTNAVTMALASGDIVIRTQPVSYTGAINDLTQFTTEAEGTNLTYQWYVSQDGGSTWAKTYNTGYNTPSLSVRLYSYRSGYQYKCVITSGNSVSVETDVATIAMRPITLKITEQPRNAGGPVGSNVTFHVGATGNGLSYQWQFSKDGASWGNTSMTGGKTDTVTVPVTAARDGTQYRCVITDDSGTSQATNAAILRVGAAPVITGQPESYNGPAGGTATFTVIAEGESLTYQWQYSNTGGSTWSNSGAAGATTASIDVKATTARNGQQYRCIVTNEYGSIVSEPATLTIE